MRSQVLDKGKLSRSTILYISFTISMITNLRLNKGQRFNCYISHTISTAIYQCILCWHSQYNSERLAILNHLVIQVTAFVGGPPNMRPMTGSLIPISSAWVDGCQTPLLRHKPSPPLHSASRYSINIHSSAARLCFFLASGPSSTSGSLVPQGLFLILSISQPPGALFVAPGLSSTSRSLLATGVTSGLFFHIITK
jgi:hypothetical protein